MHAVNKILQTQFPYMQGLQSTLKSQTKFDPVAVSGYHNANTYIKLHVFIHSMHFTISAVQIHHVPEQAHWVTSSYIGGEVSASDSLSNGSLTEPIIAAGGVILLSLTKWGADGYPTPSTATRRFSRLRTLPIANAYSVAMGENPCSTLFHFKCVVCGSSNTDSWKCSICSLCCLLEIQI